MPSFFYNLAFDLTTELALKPHSADTYWDAFRVRLKTNPQQRPASQSQVNLVAALSDTPRAGSTEKPAARGGSSSQPPNNLDLPLACSGQDVLKEELSTSSKAKDWRYGRILAQGVKMAPAEDRAISESKASNVRASGGIGTGQGGLGTKGRFEPSSTEEEELGWGVVRLYRDGEETPGLYDEPTHAKGSRITKALHGNDDADTPAFKDEDCTTLCILAVPSYLTPSDFLGFVGEKTREEVSHFRMIRTEKSNRYMVLMKFRNGRKAREWRNEWNGKVFDGMEVDFPISYPPRSVANSCMSIAGKLSRRLRQVHSFPLPFDLHHQRLLPSHDQ